MVFILVFVIIVTLGVLFLIYKYGPSIGLSSTSTPLVGSSISGKTPFDSTVDLPKSSDQPQGITFSYSTWLFFNDFSYRYGEEKVIFTKGPTDMSSMCPGVFLDANTNSLLVKLDTMGAREIVVVSNLPAKKWIHLALAVDQDSIDVYINGVIHTHRSFAQIPRQNPSPVHIGVGGGFDGKLSVLNYYPYFLKNTDIAAIMGTPPQIDKSELDTSTNAYDISWWTNA